MREHRRQYRTSRLSIAISAILHAAIIATLFFLAAREGMLGKELKKIAVTMVPKEKPPEKPKEKPPEPKPAPDEPKPAPVASVQAPPQVRALASAPSTPAVAPVAAPPAAALPAFDFAGGKPVETTADPNRLYKSYVEYTLRSNWERPEGVADQNYTAEVALRIDPQGRILETTWQTGSGNPVWDASVKAALAKTRSLGRVPPKRFPERVVVRFDVQVADEIALQ